MSDRPPLELVAEGLASVRAYHTPPDPAPIKLDANESPWPLSDRAREELARELAKVPLHRYPDLGARRLRALLGERLGCDPSELVLGVGSDEVIGILMAALSRPRAGRDAASVLFPTPSFVMYGLTARVHGLLPVPVPLGEGFALDLQAMLHAIETRRPNLIFLATPNNPTGNAFDDADVLRVIDAAPDALVVVDEAYAPFAGRSLGSLCAAHANAAVLGTLSKIGLAGLRVGWARLHPALATEVEKARPPYNLGSLPQRAAEVALSSLRGELDEHVHAIVRERERLRGELAPLARVHPSQANFLLVEFDDAAATQARLREGGIQVRAFPNEPRLARCLRITVGTPAENDALIAALRPLLG